MEGSTDYYVRTRYKSRNGIQSDWSPPVHFTTKAAFQGNEVQKTFANDAASSDYLGQCVALSRDGQYAVVGAPYDDDKGSSSGSVYIYQRSGVTWVFQRKVIAADGQASDRFGEYIAVNDDGSRIAVGVPLEDTVGGSSGAVYVFTREGDTWTQIKKLTASDGQASDFFGYSVALSGNGSLVIVGAYGDDDRKSAAGAFYTFA